MALRPDKLVHTQIMNMLRGGVLYVHLKQATALRPKPVWKGGGLPMRMYASGTCAWLYGFM